MIANATVSGWRGVEVDTFGDEVDLPLDVGTAYMTSAPIQLVEKSRSEWNPESLQWRSVAYLKGRMYANRDIRKGDRLKNEKTGAVYIVDKVSDGSRGFGAREVSFEVRAL